MYMIFIYLQIVGPEGRFSNGKSGLRSFFICQKNKKPFYPEELLEKYEVPNYKPKASPAFKPIQVDFDTAVGVGVGTPVETFQYLTFRSSATSPTGVRLNL